MKNMEKEHTLVEISLQLRQNTDANDLKKNMEYACKSTLLNGGRLEKEYGTST